MKRTIKLQSVALTQAATSASTAARTIARSSLGDVPYTIIVLNFPRKRAIR